MPHALIPKTRFIAKHFQYGCQLLSRAITSSSFADEVTKDEATLQVALSLLILLWMNAPHTGQSSQLIFEANARGAQFLAIVAGSA